MKGDSGVFKRSVKTILYVNRQAYVQVCSPSMCMLMHVIERERGQKKKRGRG